MRFVKWFISVGLVCLSSSAVAETPPASVWVATSVSQQMQAQLWLPGTVASRHDAEIAAEISGRLTWIAEVGTQVAAGDVLARIDDSYLALELAAAESAIVRLQAQLTFLDKKLERFTEVARSQGTSQNELDELTSSRDMAVQELVEANISREQIKHRLARTQVKAPYDGLVVSRVQQPGEYTEIGEDLLRLVQISTREVRIQAPLSVAAYLKVGDQVEVSYLNQSAMFAVRTLIPVGDQRSRTMELRLQMNDTDWPVGAAVKVALPNSQPMQVIAVPRDALVLRGKQRYVFSIDEEGAASRIEVSTGIAQGDLIQVVGELSAGQAVVVRGAERLQPGQKVKVENRLAQAEKVANIEG
ncbi:MULTISPECIES: efflux RND transporter periplasmic adaptor subunit [Corallincola]|uniref:Efflux RND transporter periplasmic adaptor subunit n=3 Tax=Corallincola TaxID=1775176 RepID=A0A368NKD1_9GAMM|nr:MULTISPECIES: efflux RND transporter periplasmic adaptor subunit [Corallincola]RCU50908.1 efflux RND transporter periplasmic adaptor subunit [Corallincola holothuriorum]TAA45862.1 efflux RND transporter periplasmic adaptor subunit [Corallincola spongiicola]TCI03959.1 efflux RND transporter periplasmic adaptor subunit [Corallincola luteus]